jgi:tetratricopeptide (TPR) repeat protein
VPTVIHGIGTWHYGKRRIHALKDVCEFCNRQVTLESYDTTLFFVVVFVPVIPLVRRRILRQCPTCQKCRYIGLAKWEASKARDGEALMEKLARDPNDREAILQAINFATGYQDEPLFNRVVETLAGDSANDAAIQARLGDAYAYFSRWPEAETAYQASLAAQDDEAVREQLALALLRQDRPDEARPYLQHVIDKKKAQASGAVYVLVQGYQAQGRHEDALAVMDERDEAFPDWAAGKEYQKQRKTSVRYDGTAKKIRSPFLDAGRAGYREGNWTARAPHLIAALVLLGAVGLYLGSAIWIGQSRKVYLVNGTGQPYTVVVESQEYQLRPHAATPVHVPEGEVEVAFKAAGPGLEPVRSRIETGFWGRPFGGHTFVINPDRSAVVLEEEGFYAENNPRQGGPTKVHFGTTFYSLTDIDYEFENFPPSLSVKKGEQLRKTRVGLAPGLAPETYLNLVQGLEPGEQVPFCKRLLALDPDYTLLLYWLVTRMPTDESIRFLEPRLDDKPVRVDWHRAYQTQTERASPGADLRPRYRKLVADTNGQADALYLLGRAEPDHDEGEKLYRQAATANPPSGYAASGLGYRALCEARFGEARDWLEKALPLVPDKTTARHFYRETLLANRDYDVLLQSLRQAAQVPGGKTAAALQMIRVHAIRGDREAARRAAAELAQEIGPQFNGTLDISVNMLIATCEGDAAGYLNAVGSDPTVEAAILRGQLKDAVGLMNTHGGDAIAYRGLLYLEAARTGAKDLADSYWNDLLADLNKGGREERLFADALTGRVPRAADQAARLPIDPSMKRVLLTVLARRDPNRADEVLPLAKRLDYHRDAVSLCLQKYWKGR